MADKMIIIHYDWLQEAGREIKMVRTLLALFGCDFLQAFDKGIAEGKKIPEIIKNPDMPEQIGPADQNVMHFAFVPEIWLKSIRKQYKLEDQCWRPRAFYESHSGNSVFSLWHYIGGTGAKIIVHVNDSSSLREALNDLEL